jgi:uncharacterized protein
MFMKWLWHSLYSTAVMFWETLWALVWGFSLSAFLQVCFRKEQITKQFGRAGLREVALATFLGAVSSSCSYAATATAKTFFKKGAALVPTLAASHGTVDFRVLQQLGCVPQVCRDDSSGHGLA